MCACTYTYMTSLVKASYWQEPFLNYWGVPNARIHLKHMVHTHTYTQMQHVYAQTHSDKYTRSNGSCRCCKWQRQERPITTATDLTTILPASVKCSLSHSLSPPQKNLKHIYAHPHTQTLRDAGRNNENTTICSRSLFFFLFFLADTPTHACTHLHAQRKPFSRFPPITAALACRRGRQEATFRKQKGAVALLRWRAHTRSRLQLQCKSQDERGAESLPHSSVHISQNPPSLLLLFPISRRAA